MIRKYRRKPMEVHAMQNDGTDNCAAAMASWVRAHGGMATAMPIGTVDEDKTQAYVHVENERAQRIAAPGMWVVHTQENRFFVLSDRDFTYLYEEVEPLPEEPPS